MTDGPRPRVSRAAYLLGYAGLLPQVGAVALAATPQTPYPDDWSPFFAYILALGYSSLILSFLGGIWWGLAMRRDHGRSLLALIAVVPSLVALMLILPGVMMAGSSDGARWPLTAVGLALILTLFVDRQLVRAGDAPPDWMRLRTPLSVGLGALTLATAFLMRF